ncbi:hypothetical protein PR003_g28264 [Phytophthora rubi]|uniref:Uncharacterized protein n=1 Tax=Phytophthora rubi TaxID=129364 RepID=A0A6A4BVI6_9STRA|nr:hypothetical protein PR003_g28264 [Phytophthora rubi]
MQQPTAADPASGDGDELGHRGDNHGNGHFNDGDSGKRGCARAAGFVTAERDGSRVEALGPVRLVGR